MSSNLENESSELSESRGASKHEKSIGTGKAFKTIHVGSRESKLALIQTNFVVEQLDQVYRTNHDNKNLTTETSATDGSQISPSDLTESDFMDHTALNFKTMKSKYEFKYSIQTMKTIGDKILDPTFAGNW